MAKGYSSKKDKQKAIVTTAGAPTDGDGALKEVQVHDWKLTILDTFT